MGAFVGLLAGLGVLLVWHGLSAPTRARSARMSGAKTRELLAQAGLPGVSPARLVAAQVALGLVAGAITFVVTQSISVSLVFVTFRRRRAAAPGHETAPQAPGRPARALARGRRQPDLRRPRRPVAAGGARRRSARAGRSRCGSRFVSSAPTTGPPGGSTSRLDRLKDALADPVGDRVVESLRVAREVGGTDLGRLLSTLSAFLRDDARTRAELLARQSWSVNAARMAVAAPWLVLLLLATQRETLQAYDTPTGTVILVAGRGTVVRRVPADDPDRPAARGPAGAAVNLVALGALLGALAAAGLLSPSSPRRRCAGRRCPTGSRPIWPTSRGRPGCSNPAGPGVAATAIRPADGAGDPRRRHPRRPDPGRPRGRRWHAGSPRSIRRSPSTSSAPSRCCGARPGAAVGAGIGVLSVLLGQSNPLILVMLIVACAVGRCARPRLVADAGGHQTGRRDHRRVPGDRRDARARRHRRRGPDGRDRPGHPARVRAAGRPTRRHPGRDPFGHIRSSLRSQPPATAPDSSRWPDSSTAWRSRSNAAPRLPTCCARRPRTSGRSASGNCWNPAAARRSR